MSQFQCVNLYDRRDSISLSHPAGYEQQYSQPGPGTSMQAASKLSDTFSYRHASHPHEVEVQEQTSAKSSDVVQPRDAGYPSHFLTTIREQAEPSPYGELDPAAKVLYPHSPHLAAVPPPSSYASGYDASNMNPEDPSRSNTVTSMQRSPFSVQSAGGQALIYSQPQAPMSSPNSVHQTVPAFSHTLNAYHDGQHTTANNEGVINSSCNPMMSAWGSGGGSFTDPATVDRNNNSSFRAPTTVPPVMPRQDPQARSHISLHDAQAKPHVSVSASTFVRRALAGSQTEAGPGNAMVRMSRSEAWSKFLAYEGCVQICYSLREEPQAQLFLDNGMALLREGFGLDGLLLSAMIMQDHSCEDDVGKKKSDVATAQWKQDAADRARSRKSKSNAFPVNEICWDDMEHEAETDNHSRQDGYPTAVPQHPAGVYDNQASRAWGSGHVANASLRRQAPWTDTNPSFSLSEGHARNRNSGFKLERSALLAGDDCEPDQFADDLAVSSGPRLQIKVHRAVTSTGGNVLNRLFGGLGSGGVNSHSGNLMVRVSCGSSFTSISLDRRGMTSSSSPYLTIPSQTLEGGGGSTGGAEEQLRVELIGPAGKLAEGVIDVSRLSAVSEQHALMSGPMSTPPGGIVTEVALFSVVNGKNGTRQRCGTLELAVQTETTSPSSTTLLSAVPPAQPSFSAAFRQPVDYKVTEQYHQAVPQLRVQASSRQPTLLESTFEGPGSGTTTTKGGLLRINACTVMDVMLEAALKMAGCSSTKLMIEGPWKWMIQQFAAHFKVTYPYTLMAHLRWVLKPEVCTMTYKCFRIICLLMTPLLQQEAQGSLSKPEASLLTQLKHQTQQFLCLALEQYTELRDGSVAFVMSEGQGGARGQRQQQDSSESSMEINAKLLPPLQECFRLYEIMRSSLNTLHETDSDWLHRRFLTAAQRRWQALLSFCKTEGGLDVVTMLQNLRLDKQVKTAQELEGRAAAAAASLIRSNRMSAKRRATQPPIEIIQESPQDVGIMYSVQGSSNSGIDKEHLYKGMEALCYAIMRDVHLDLQIQGMPNLGLPSGLNLPRITAEEHCTRFHQQLRELLSSYPPETPSTQAVNLLVAVAELQKYLEGNGLVLEPHHPGHLNTMALFHSHVNNWLRTSQEVLCKQCLQLERQPQDPSRRFPAVSPSAAAGGAPPMPMPPQLYDSTAVGARISAMVTRMQDYCWQELQCYERVVMHWAAFGLDLEATMCKVTRVVLAALCRQCGVAARSAPQAQGPMNDGYGADPWSLQSSSGGRAHMRSPSQAGGSLSGSAVGAHRRTQSDVYVTGYGGEGSSLQPTSRGDAPAAAFAARPESIHSGTSPYGSPRARAATVSTLPPWQQMGMPLRVEVPYTEAVLLNSLKYLMVSVPGMEETLLDWCQTTDQQAVGIMVPVGNTVASPQQHIRGNVAAMIGAQFDQLVSEVRTEYATAVSCCAARLTAALCCVPASHLQAALHLPDTQAGNLVYRPQQQQQALRIVMAPVLSGLETALTALRGSLEPRVYVAVGRALWDLSGKELHQFVQGLHETGSDGMESAWRARQRAGLAVVEINEFFKQRLLLYDDASMQERDLELPGHVELVLKQLQRSNALTNMAYNPL